MNILSLISGLISLASAIAEYAKNRQLIGAGEAQALNRVLAEGLSAIERAQAARRVVRHDVDSMRNDPDNRDKR